MKLAALLIPLLCLCATEARRAAFESGSREFVHPAPPSNGNKLGHGVRWGHEGQRGQRFGSDSHEHHGGHRKHPGHYQRPSFFQNLTKEETREFYKIICNQNLTKADVKAELEAWAEEHNVTESFKEEEQKMKNAKEESRTKMTELLMNVTSLHEELQEIEDNMDITKKEERKQKAKLLRETARPVVRAYYSLQWNMNRKPSRPHIRPGGGFPGGNGRFPRPSSFPGNRGRFGNNNGFGAPNHRFGNEERRGIDFSEEDDFNFENRDMKFPFNDMNEFDDEDRGF